MKSTTVLGGLALPFLTAFASAVEGPSRVQRAPLEGRGNKLQYCCVQIFGLPDAPYQKSLYVPWVAAEQLTIYQQNDNGNCRIYAHQTGKAPSDGGCADWTFNALPCFGDPYNPDVQVAPHYVCDGPMPTNAAEVNQG
ncbi:hypothetical protein E4U54_005600 [Claviceps lovelessii]|nr:hypothetical protein E4U54_005600 [Claviceps lovelessii]